LVERTLKSILIQESNSRFDEMFKTASVGKRWRGVEINCERGFIRSEGYHLHKKSVDSIVGKCFAKIKTPNLETRNPKPETAKPPNPKPKKQKTFTEIFLKSIVLCVLVGRKEN
jgi:hypothetical protein